jgi:hypothetical protein
MTEPQPYPHRPACFQGAFTRLLIDALVARDLGAPACWLLAVLVAEEACQGFARSVLFFPDELMRLIDVRKPHTFYDLRARLMARGWLSFTSQQTRTRGWYHVLVPADLLEQLAAISARIGGDLVPALMPRLVPLNGIGSDCSPADAAIARPLVSVSVPPLPPPSMPGLAPPNGTSRPPMPRLTPPNGINQPPGPSVGPRAVSSSRRTLHDAAAAAASAVLSESIPDSAAREAAMGDDDEPIAVVGADDITRDAWLASLDDDVRDRVQPILDPRYGIDIDLDRSGWIAATLNQTATDVVEVLALATGAILWPSNYSELRATWNTKRVRARQHAAERQSRDDAEAAKLATAARIQASTTGLRDAFARQRERVLAWFDSLPENDPQRRLIDTTPALRDAFAQLRAGVSTATTLVTLTGLLPDLLAIRRGAQPATTTAAP